MGARLFLASTAEEAEVTARTWPARLLNFGLVLIGVALAITFVFQSLHYRWNWAAAWKYRALFWQGWIHTLAIAAGALAGSTLAGLAGALASRSRWLALRAASQVYVELIRGTPLLVQILVLFYVVAPPFKLENRYVVGVGTLALFAGAYLTEIIRAGIASVGRSQWLTARSLGLTRSQTYRLVVFPQAFRQILPPLAGQFVSLIKDSSLLSVIGIGEFTLNAQQVNSITYSTLESYLPLAVGYLLLTLPLSLWARQLERRTHFET